MFAFPERDRFFSCAGLVILLSHHFATNDAMSAFVQSVDQISTWLTWRHSNPSCAVGRATSRALSFLPRRNEDGAVDVGIRRTNLGCVTELLNVRCSQRMGKTRSNSESAEDSGQYNTPVIG